MWPDGSLPILCSDRVEVVVNAVSSIVRFYCSALLKSSHQDRLLHAILTRLANVDQMRLDELPTRDQLKLLMRLCNPSIAHMTVSNNSGNSPLVFLVMPHSAVNVAEV